MAITSWILAINKAGAKIYERKSRIDQLRLVTDIPNSDGRLQNREIGSDKPGRSNASTSRSRHSYSSEVDPKEQVVEKFTREVADMLDHESYFETFDELVVIAEPGLLGTLRKKLTKRLEEKVSTTIQLDLGYLTENELVRRIEKELEDARP